MIRYALIFCMLCATCNSQTLRALIRTDLDGADIDTNQRQSVMLQSLYADCVLVMPVSRDKAPNVTDFSTSFNDGTFPAEANEATFTNGFGGAYDFDGIDDYVHKNSAVGGTVPMTMTCWMKSAVTANDSVVWQGNTNSSVQYYTIGMGPNGKGMIRARFTSDTITEGTTQIDDSTWHHVAGVFSAANSRILYVDGTPEATSTVSRSSANHNGTEIGRSGDLTPANYFTGTADDCHVYNAALSDADILGIYTSTTNTYGVN